MHNNITKIVKLITSEIKTCQDKKDKWASFKRENAQELKDLLELNHTAFENPGNLLGFDIDDDRKLILLNYTGQAHNELHGVENGWSMPLREMRGLIYSFSEEEPVLVSRGFEKFFNFSELPENSYESLTDKYGKEKYLVREKADGHMIEYFVHNGELCASTRGKFGTASSIEALDMFSINDFNRINDQFNGNILSLVVELVTKNTEVHVNYNGFETLYLLAAFDKQGNKLCLEDLQEIGNNNSELFTMPKAQYMSLDEMINEVQNRDIENCEGWVVDFNGELIKFKYIDYIGRMVNAKLSYKYIMNCIRSNRLDRMFYTLPEEIRVHAYEMVKEVKLNLEKAKVLKDHKVLYRMHSEMEGGKSYFQSVCRLFYKESINQGV